MTQEELVELGFRSEALLNSQTFKFVVNHLSNGYANNILLSKPLERQAREEAYFHHKALSDVVAQLNAFVETKDAIVAKDQKEQEEDNE